MMEYLSGLTAAAAASGLLVGVVLAGLVVRGRIKHRYDHLLALAQGDQRILQEKLGAQQETTAQWRTQLAQTTEEVLRNRQQAEALNVANASLETQLQRIPLLEKELAEIKIQSDRLQMDLRRESAALAQAVEKSAQLQKLEGEKAQKEEQLAALQHQLSQCRAQMAELGTLLEEQRKQAGEKIALLNEARDQLKNEFQNLAQKIFEEKSTRFADQNKAAMDQLIVPLREQIGDFKKRVEDVYDKESRDRTALHTEINHLKELNQRISKEALNLTRALKGDSKARGNWGEVILERVLEASGLQKGREYEVQVSLKDPEGKRYQPDAVVRLPEGKDVIIDAKVSLKDYEAFYSAESAEEKEKHLAAHIEAMRVHIRGLAAKSYEELEGVRTLDFTLMFVPIEAAFLAAVEKDGALFAEAFEKNIMVVSPSTLLVTLRTIQNIWRHEYQNRNALEIAKKAGGLYDKLVGFVEALEEVGRQLDKARDAYRTAHDRLAAGKGNLIKRSQELIDLGVKAGKRLPNNLLENAETEAEE
ncbi:MAG: DNA recombination protein RmuC [Desulfobacteraceae bacterium]|nr:DNA recombination protein RmuC [Desulfobacteraceae bacterium]